MPKHKLCIRAMIYILFHQCAFTMQAVGQTFWPVKSISEVGGREGYKGHG